MGIGEMDENVGKPICYLNESNNINVKNKVAKNYNKKPCKGEGLLAKGPIY